MRITVKVHTFYDWVPVPPDTEITQEDVNKGIVKPDQNNGWTMRVSKKLDTETNVSLPEEQIIQVILQEMIRDKVVRSRSEAVALYLARHVMKHNAHPDWMESFEVHDDGADKELFMKMVDEHVACGNLEELDRDRMVEAYVAECSSEDHARELETHFGVKQENKSARHARDKSRPVHQDQKGVV